MLKQTPDSYLHCIVHEWQKGLNLLARICKVPAALIMHTDGKEIEVFASSDSSENPFHPGEHQTLEDSGLYCEHVIRNKKSLMVPNALEDPIWNQNPDIKLGMISYLGLPIKYPNGDVFGTLCILDHKENRYSKDYERLMEHFRNMIEISLGSISQYEKAYRRNQEQGDVSTAAELARKALNQLELLSEQLRSGQPINVEAMAELKDQLSKCTELLQAV